MNRAQFCSRDIRAKERDGRLSSWSRHLTAKQIEVCFICAELGKVRLVPAIAVSVYFAMTTRSNGPAEVGMLEGEGKWVRKSIIEILLISAVLTSRSDLVPSSPAYETVGLRMMTSSSSSLLPLWTYPQEERGDQTDVRGGCSVRKVYIPLVASLCVYFCSEYEVLLPVPSYRPSKRTQHLGSKTNSCDPPSFHV